MPNYLEFRISSGLKNIIGKELITDDFIAIFELVKNSYDAYAQNVIITFEKDKIIIADDGKGMSLNDINRKWLFVAYSAKKDGTEDEESFKLNNEKKASYRDNLNQKKRYYAGAKGIGRFSCDRLGKYLRMITQKRNSSNIEQIFVDWTKFEEKPADTFQQIKVEHETLKTSQSDFPYNANNGTVLEITGLSSSWDRDKLRNLKHSLEKLINPFSEKDEFNIEVICEREIVEDRAKNRKGEYKHIERNRINGKIKNSILDVLAIKTTHLSVEITSKVIKTKIQDRGTLMYLIEEQNKIYKFLEDVKIDLYFLNSIAKTNFTRKMGIEPVNFGSIFLFKNGFRVQPFGKIGDDSWNINFGAQQGYNRKLSTRDLFGRVDITTNDNKQFKEVSSRDGGLVYTAGYFQLMKAFKEKGLKILERYVVGVLWGEGFKRKNYFGEGKEATLKIKQYRDKLKTEDKFSNSAETIVSNLGSKLDFMQIVKSLVSNKEIKIIDFNENLIDLVNEKLEEVNSKYLVDLKKVAEKTNNSKFKKKILEADKKYQALIKAKERAERKAKEEEQKRLEAEKRAKEEEEKRKAAEADRKKAEEGKRKAELEALKKENEKLKAEKKAREEKIKREKAEAEKRKEEEERKKAEKEAARRKEQVTRYRAAETIEYKDLRDSNHIIGVYSDDIAKKILLLKRNLDKGKEIPKKKLLNFINGISLSNEKIATLTRFTTKENYLKASLETEENIIGYIRDYIKNGYQVLYSINIEFINEHLSFIRKFNPIELSVAIDNILSNSRKKNTTKIIFEFNIIDEKLQIKIRDIGQPLSKKITDWNLIFEEGVTTTRGAGLGLNHVKRIIEDDLKGTIVYNPNYKDGFELIITLS